MSLGSFTCPNLIKSSMNNIVAIALTEACNKSTQAVISLGSDNSFKCEFKDVNNLTVTGKFDSKTNELTLYNELLPEEITGENTLISFALVTIDGKKMNGCTLCSNTCYGSNATLSPTDMKLNSIIDKNDNTFYNGVLISFDKLTICSVTTCLPMAWPKLEDYANIKDYLIQCCKLSLFFRNCSLTSAMCHNCCLNQRLSNTYCNM